MRRKAIASSPLNPWLTLPLPIHLCTFLHPKRRIIYRLTDPAPFLIPVLHMVDSPPSLNAIGLPLQRWNITHIPRNITRGQVPVRQQKIGALLKLSHTTIVLHPSRKILRSIVLKPHLPRVPLEGRILHLLFDVLHAINAFSRLIVLTI
jgi:hypothetical protein